MGHISKNKEKGELQGKKAKHGEDGAGEEHDDRKGATGVQKLALPRLIIVEVSYLILPFFVSIRIFFMSFPVDSALGALRGASGSRPDQTSSLQFYRHLLSINCSFISAISLFSSVIWLSKAG
jgi:hypothetical protein